MHPPGFPVDLKEWPIPCTVCLSQEGMIGMGKVWAFSPESCHVESVLSVSPGMMVSLSLQLPGIAKINLKQGLIIWTRNWSSGCDSW